MLLAGAASRVGRPTTTSDRSPATATAARRPATSPRSTCCLLSRRPTGFAALGVPERIDLGLAAAGFAQPFAIQTEAIPIAMQGRDVCGRAETGSGKTLAFGVPMLARITDVAEPSAPLGLVLVPTRELAIQVAEVLVPVAAKAGMRVLAVYGGASRHQQIEALARGVELVIATPLRLIDLLKSGEVDVGRVQIVCLDEADRMADDGFTPQVEWILRHCTGRSQTMLFSATLDGDVGHLIRHYLTDPIEVAVDSETGTVGTMHHLFLAVHHMDKDRVIGAIAPGHPQGPRVLPDQAPVRPGRRPRSTISASASPRSTATSRSRRANGRCVASPRASCAVLVATDVAARGIDIDDIGVVIHYEPAKDAKDYLHRSGRTARAGRDGWAITFVEYNQHTQMRILQRGAPPRRTRRRSRCSATTRTCATSRCSKPTPRSDRYAGLTPLGCGVFGSRERLQPRTRRRAARRVSS